MTPHHTPSAAPFIAVLGTLGIAALIVIAQMLTLGVAVSQVTSALREATKCGKGQSHVLG